MRNILKAIVLTVILASCAAEQGGPAASAVPPTSGESTAQLLDPEAVITTNGYHSVRTGDDGVTQFYTFTERATPERISVLSRQIEALPKDEQLVPVCELMRGGAKAMLIEQTGIALDVAVTNYGYSGSTIACTLKYMTGNSVGTQHVISKQGRHGMYMVFVTD